MFSTYLLFAVILITANSTITFSQNPETDSLIGEIAITPGVKYVLRNAGSIINNKDVNYAPCISSNGLRLYYVSTVSDVVDTNGTISVDHSIYCAQASSIDNKTFNQPVLLSSPINSSTENEGAVAISSNGEWFYFTACNRDIGQGDCDIYQCKFDGESCAKIQINSTINSDTWDAQPTITKNGRQLFFCSTRMETPDQECDIYYTQMRNSGEWGLPIRLRSPINSPAIEAAPYIFLNDSILVFSSNRIGGYGSFDFYASYRGSNGKWKTPINLGSFINTEKDERFISTNADGSVIYFASERTDVGNYGKLDIFVMTRLDKK